MIESAKPDIGRLRTPAKVAHNTRVLEQFNSSSEARRRIRPTPNRRLGMTVGTVNVRLSPHLSGATDSGDHVLYYNFRAAPLDGETARMTLELAHWLLQSNGITLPLRVVEYVDLQGRSVHRTSRLRPTTRRRAQQTAKIISTLWDSI